MSAVVHTLTSQSASIHFVCVLNKKFEEKATIPNERDEESLRRAIGRRMSNFK